MFGPSFGEQGLNQGNRSGGRVLGLEEEAWLEIGLVDLTRVQAWYQGARLLGPDAVVFLVVVGLNLLAKAGRGTGRPLCMWHPGGTEIWSSKFPPVCSTSTST